MGMGISWRQIGATDADKKVKERRRAIAIRLVPALRRNWREGLRRIKISTQGKWGGSMRRHVRFWSNRVKRTLGVLLVDSNFFRDLTKYFSVTVSPPICSCSSKGSICICGEVISLISIIDLDLVDNENADKVTAWRIGENRSQ